MTIPSEADLLAASSHIGHRSFKWNPKMKRFLYGIKNGVHIFDLTVTRDKLSQVCQELAELHKKDKSILFVSTKQHVTHFLENIGSATGHPIVTKKWIPGLLTNWKTISRRIKYYLDLQESFQTGEVEKYTKSEQTRLRKKLAKLDNALAGVAGMKALPDALFVVDTVRDIIAVREARTIGVPVYGICDSNSDPDMLTVPIPANDDAVSSVRLILDTIKDALEESKEEKEVKQEEATATI